MACRRDQKLKQKTIGSGRSFVLLCPSLQRAGEEEQIRRWRIFRLLLVWKEADWHGQVERKTRRFNWTGLWDLKNLELFFFLFKNYKSSNLTPTELPLYKRNIEKFHKSTIVFWVRECAKTLDLECD